MANLMTASKQWATRPDDQRFTSLIELNDFVQASRDNSHASVISSRALTCSPVEGDNKGLVVGNDNVQVNLTNWSFGQICQRAGAPAGYLRKLPSPLAADLVNYGLWHERDSENLGILVHKNGGEPELRAVTGAAYGRVWNSSITQALVDRFGDGITGDFRVPGEFGVDVDVTKQNTTLYASDRDMFVFLADEKNRITIPDRRDGKSGDLARGFFVWNSEVGSSTLGIATFLFDFVCCNRIVWGAQQYAEIKIRHTANAGDKWLEQVVPAIENYANSSTTTIVQAVSDAKKAHVDNVDDFLAKRFSRSQSADIIKAHEDDEHRPMENLWDVATGITAYARSVPHQDARVALEREAGKILDMA